MDNNKRSRDISFAEAVALLAIYVIIFVLRNGAYPVGISIILCVIVTAGYGVLVLHHKFDDIFTSILDTFHRGMPALLILLMVGFITSSWIASGTIPTLIVYGLKIMRPEIFLVASFLICFIVTEVTGSSGAICATIGLALISIASATGIPIPMAAGAIVSGCWTGDKWSPMSDTTNLGAAMSKENVVEVWKHMFPTSGLGVVITAGIFMVIGFTYDFSNVNNESLTNLIHGIETSFVVHPALLIPIVVVLVLAAMKKPILPVLMLGVALGVVMAVFVQNDELPHIFDALYNGYVSETGMADIDKLLSAGGLASMMDVTLIIFCAFTFAGTLDKFNILGIIVSHLTFLTKSRGVLILSTWVTAVLATVLGGTSYVGCILPAQMFPNAYEKLGLSKKTMARTILEGAAHLTSIIPWGVSHALIMAALNVPSSQFLPYYFSFWVSSALCILFGFTGWFTKKVDLNEA